MYSWTCSSIHTECYTAGRALRCTWGGRQGHPFTQVLPAMKAPALPWSMVPLAESFCFSHTPQCYCFVMRRRVATLMTETFPSNSLWCYIVVILTTLFCSKWHTFPFPMNKAIVHLQGGCNITIHYLKLTNAGYINNTVLCGSRGSVSVVRCFFLVPFFSSLHPAHCRWPATCPLLPSMQRHLETFHCLWIPNDDMLFKILL